MKTNSTLPDPEQRRTNFRTFLQAELARRCLENPQYSLRAFAGRIGVDHSTLSQILRGRRALTERTIRLVAKKLEQRPEAIEEFVALQRAQGEDPRDREVRRLTRDMICVVSDWYHYAILELTHLKGFQADSRWIARALDITIDEVNAAVSRMAGLRLLEMEAPDRWIDRSGDSAASFDDFTQIAIRQWSSQLHERSLVSLDKTPSEHRELSSTTLAINTKRLPEVKRRIDRFQRDLIDLLDRDTDHDDVFQLEIHLFPLTNLNREP